MNGTCQEEKNPKYDYFPILSSLLERRRNRLGLQKVFDIKSFNVKKKDKCIFIIPNTIEIKQVQKL